VHFRTLVTVLGLAVLTAWWVGCRGAGHGQVQRVRVPEGASFAQVTDSLAAHHIVRAPLLFQLFAHLTGAARHVKPGTYGFREATGWDRVLRDLGEGRVLQARLVVPEGFRLNQLTPRIARIVGWSEDSVLKVLLSPATARRFRVPGPTLEGYLYPATYTWGIDVPFDTMLATMVRRYRRVWTPSLRALADSAGLDERAAVTLASIVQAEAKIAGDMAPISAVYHNRLRIGMPLQADPTVQYALGQHRRDHLMYADIRGVAADPYNTYTHKGLPPGPIGNPSEQALEAALRPARVNYLYFVARPDGTDIFSTTLAQHNLAKQQVKALITAESLATRGLNPGVAAAESAGTAPTVTPAAATAGQSAAAATGGRGAPTTSTQRKR
jgi:UPF0755 protein